MPVITLGHRRHVERGWIRRSSGSCYTLPTVEWLVERAHAQALQRMDRPDIIEIEGGWEAFAGTVLEKSRVHPRERSAVRSLVRMLANTPIRWQDGARSSSLFMVHEDPAAAGRGRGRSVISLTLDGRLLDHEYHRGRLGSGPATGRRTGRTGGSCRCPVRASSPTSPAALTIARLHELHEDYTTGSTRRHRQGLPMPSKILFLLMTPA